MKTGRGALGIGVAVVMALLPSCHPAAGPSATTPTSTAVALAAGEIRRTLVESQPATGLEGWETRLYLIEYGPGATAPLHVHPAVGVGRVLEGSFESAFGDEPVVHVHAGQGFVDPAGVPHRIFRNLDPARPLRFVIAYTLRAGEPNFYPGGTLPAAPPRVSLAVTREPQTDVRSLYATEHERQR